MPSCIDSVAILQRTGLGDRKALCALRCCPSLRPDEELRAAARRALHSPKGCITPMFAVVDFGFENIAKAVMEESKVSVSNGECNSGEVIHDVDGVQDCGRSKTKAEAELYGHLKGLAGRLGRIVLGEEHMERMQAEGKTLDGRLSVRCYRQLSDEITHPQLGAHVDGNLFTLLISNKRGLQVLDPELAGACPPSIITSYGMPSIGAAGAVDAFEIKDEHFVDPFDNHQGDCADVILFTAGSAMTRMKPIPGSFTPPACPVLHRVAYHNQDTDPDDVLRYSIPYLVDVHPF